MFFDTASVMEASTVDGIHLDEDQHRLLDEAIAHDISERNIFQAWHQQENRVMNTKIGPMLE